MLQVKPAVMCSHVRLTISRLRQPAAANSVQLSQWALSLAEDEPASVQLSSEVAAKGVAGVVQAVEGLSVAEPSGQPVSRVPSSVGPVSEQAAAKAAFAQRVRQEFDRRMAAGNCTPAEAAAAALKAVAASK